MRKLPLILLLTAGLSVPGLSQPFNSSITGRVVKDQDSLLFDSNQQISIEDFSYVKNGESSFFSAPKNQPGVAFLASAVIPGSGQALNGKWGRAAAYFLIEAISVAYYIERTNTAMRNEAAYERYANQNWSALAYAQWLVAYSRENGIDNDWEVLAQQLDQLPEADKMPNFENTVDDWRKVPLNTVRMVEEQTPYYYPDSYTNLSVCTNDNRCRGNFSHVLQDYGSQQYYELMSKYFQFQPGWQDFYYLWNGNESHQFQYSWDVNMLTEDYKIGTQRAEEFNNNYRQAGNILKLLVVNHVVSAFDAFFTVKLKNSRIETQTNLLRAEAVSLIWHF